MARARWNLDSLDLNELVQLRDLVERALRDKIEGERSELQARLDRLSTLQLPMNGSSAKAGPERRGRRRRGPHPSKGKKAPIKYRGPGGETWSGRGLAPRWLVELEAKGKKRDSYLVRPAE